MISKISLLCGALLSAVAWANGSHTLPIAVQERLQLANLEASDIGVVIVPTDGGLPILSHHATTPRTPASTQKLVSTAAALDMLGGGFVWQNRIYHTGVVAGGVLYGDAVLVGSGDPALDYQRFDALLYALHDKVHHITGDIYIDNGRFVNVGYNPNAFDGQGDRAYNAEPSAFLLNFGTVELKITPSGRYTTLGEQGNGSNFYPNLSADEAIVQMYPMLDGVVFPKRIGVHDGGCQMPKARLSQTKIELTGDFGAMCGVQSLWRNFGDNEALATKAVMARWRSLDPTFTGKINIGQPKQRSILPLVSLPSKPLSEQITQINQYSNNVMTEQLALSLPLYVAKLEHSDYNKAFLLLNAWWQTQLTTPPPIMSRASGLCRDCYVSPLSLSSLLTFMASHREFETFLQSLPLAGQSGTMQALSKRYADHPAIGRAWIKTGTLNDVTAMAGYVLGDSGKRYAFVAMINAKNVGYNPKAVAVLDELLAWTTQH